MNTARPDQQTSQTDPALAPAPAPVVAPALAPALAPAASPLAPTAGIPASRAAARRLAAVAPASAAGKTGTASEPRVGDPEIAHHVVSHTGQEGLALAMFLEAHGPSTDLEIIDAFANWKPSHVRRTLYKLQDSRVAQYVKDTDSSGWDTFLWHLSLIDVRDHLARRIDEEAQEARRAAAAETDGIDFTCGGHHGRVPFAKAVDLRFRCPTCQAALQACDAPWTPGAVAAAGLAPQMAEVGAA